MTKKLIIPVIIFSSSQSNSIEVLPALDRIKLFYNLAKIINLFFCWTLAQMPHTVRIGYAMKVQYKTIQFINLLSDIGKWFNQ